MGKIQQFLAYLKDVRYEMHKLVWPTKGETLGGTSLVLLSVILFSLFLGLADVGLQYLVEQFI